MRYLLFFILLFSGCQDKTYTKLYKKGALGKEISTISISESNQTIKNYMQEALKEMHFSVITGSPYALEIEAARYQHKCNNPNTSTYDATYDGFIKLTLLKNMQRIYMCQKDYHGKLNKEILITLILRMREDLKLNH